MTITEKMVRSIPLAVSCAGIHRKPCEHCPSVHSDDPESDFILTLLLAERVETAFPCGWRQNKFCKGYCDKMGITEADISELSSRKPEHFT